jgi:hypothetical protein
VEIKRPPGKGSASKKTAAPLEIPVDDEVLIPVRVVLNPVVAKAEKERLAAQERAAEKANAEKPGKNAKKRPKDKPVSFPSEIRVIANRGGRGIVVIPAIISIEGGEGVLKIQCNAAAADRVGEEGVFIIEGVQRVKGRRIAVTAPALPFRIVEAKNKPDVPPVK